MAGTGRPRGRPPTRGRRGGRATKSATARKQRVQSSDEEAEMSDKSVSDGYQSESHTPKPSTRASRSQKETSPSSAWAVIDQEVEEDDVQSDPHTEEEDELEDEGEVVDSDIEPLNTSPDFVDFTRPSTSPVRKRSGITIQTPPTPSPTKGARKRQAPPSPEVVELNEDSDKDNNVLLTRTPVKGSKSRARKVVKSKEIIEDSDVEEISESEHAKLVAEKNAQGKKKPIKPAVTAVTKKITIRGTKFPSAPVEDAENNLFLDGGSPLLRSPKKKAKIACSSESDDETLHAAVNRKKGSSDVPDTPVSKITTQLNDSVLNSARKPKAPASKAEYDAQLKKFAVALGLDSVKAYFCDAMRGTYADVYRLQVQGVSLCFGDLIYWYRLRTILLGVGIKENSKQEKELVQLITTPELTKFIINPSCCNPRGFRLVIPPKDTVGSKRPYLVRISDGQRVICVIFGRADGSSLLDLQQMGQSGYFNHSLSLCPLAVEYALALNFFSALLKFDRVNNYGDDRDMLGYKHQDVAPPPRPRAARTSVAVHTVGLDFEDSLLRVMKRSIETGGLDSFSEVFNVSSFYGPSSTTDVSHDIERFIAMCAQNERYRGELPQGSFVGVLCSPSTYSHVDHDDLQFNLLGVILLASRFGQGAETT
ncbi:hypothetical protein BDY19DRAFT_995707 [Irpex rosettiformis]|uniref:Uncharacterized protein n=1 Tax=Irpex rosettiformis TaxID=378272 RepID=A0ACB8TX86_9APHY|nr:hypothetical protein BDY19DRAFT_995707 [Irpex rosettiformis]